MQTYFRRVATTIQASNIILLLEVLQQAYEACKNSLTEPILNKIPTEGRLPRITPDINRQIAEALFRRGINSGTFYLWAENNNSTPVLNKIQNQYPDINPNSIASWLVVFQNFSTTSQSSNPQISQGQQNLLNPSGLEIVLNLLNTAISDLNQ